mmetsp:Transcript_17946/g.24098  ORF Transcript_17946/g.24098 Transcript_17946/m.24098 type:complete len:90 (+) Transcript_17946:185-454(+)
MMQMRFKQFSIIYFFTAPMWILLLEALCLFVVRVSKWDLVRARKVFNEVAILQLLLLIPQPIYYVVGESMKAASDFGELYYPNWYGFLG